MTKLFKYQKRGVRKIRRFGGRALVADEMGLGKSIQAITYVVEENAFPCVVICPASLKYNWQKEWRKHAGIRADVFETRKPPKFSKFRKHKVIIINYDILQDWYLYFKRMKKYQNIRTIIGDECKDIKSSTSRRNKYFRRMCKGVQNILLLDGTPLTNGRPAELFPALNILRPDIFDSFFTYGCEYCEATHKNGKWEYKGATNLPKLNQLLKESCMIRRRKDQVLKDLPPKARYVVPLDIVNRKEYRKASTDFYGWLAQFGKKRLRGDAKAATFVQLGYMVRLAAELKLPAVIEWIDNYLNQTDQKLIVFGIHKKILKPIRERYHDICVFVDGSTPSKKRQLFVDEFNSKKRKRLAIGNLDAFGQGWNATACSTVLHTEMAWIPAWHTQGDDRVHGIGRGIVGQKAQSYYLVAHDTVEERLCEKLQAKQRNMSAILDGKEDVERFDIFDQLLDEIQRDI